MARERFDAECDDICRKAGWEDGATRTLMREQMVAMCRCFVRLKLRELGYEADPDDELPVRATEQAKQSRRRDGGNGIPPYGYRTVAGADGKLRTAPPAAPDAAPLVARVFEEYAAGRMHLSEVGTALT